MIKYIFAISFICFSLYSFAQPIPDTLLAKKIITMFRADQKWRLAYLKLQNGKSEYDEETINVNEAKADSLNLIEAKKIIKDHGFPGYNLIGEDGSNAFWAIVQHCDNDVAFQQQALKLMYKQVRQKNANGENYAYLEDRVLSNNHQKQLYGTQLRYNPATKKSHPLPIRDSLHVDARRKQMGMGTLADYIKFNDAHH